MRTVFVVRVLGERDLAPEIGREERVRFRDLQEAIKHGVFGPNVRHALTAANVAFKKLPIVAVEPFDCV